VDIWPDPWALEKTDPALRRREVFPLDEAGRAQVIALLREAYEAEEERWNNCPGILDCEPWAPAPEPENAE
jgi:antitoxin component HigA of HigAB toxin-antitoxin module